ncbi:surface-adhesin E family protein [Acinetobacter baumannii]
MRSLLIFISFLCFTHSANAEWIDIFKDGKEVYSVDKESMDLDLDNEKAKIWVKNTVNVAKPKLNDVVEVKSYFDIACKQRTLNLISMLSYNNKQNVVKAFNPSTPLKINAVPETVGGNIFYAICQDLIPAMKDQPFEKFTSSVVRADQCLKDAVNSKKYSVPNKSKLKDLSLQKCSSLINKSYNNAVSYASIEKGEDLTDEEVLALKLKIYNSLEEKLDFYIQ